MDTLEATLAIAGGSAGTFVANWAVMKYRINQIEKRQDHHDSELEKEIHAVNISKSSKFKELKEDYKEQVQICHARIDRLRDANDEKFKELAADYKDGLRRIEEKIDNLILKLNS